MPDPLSSNVVTQLRSDPTAALAAALILAGSFPDLVSWAMRAFGGKEGAKANGEAEANGVAKSVRAGAKKRRAKLLAPRAATTRVRPPPSMTRRCWR